MDNAELISTIKYQLEVAKKILVVSHLRPDGDAIGSLLGIALPLLEKCKDVQLVLSDGVPKNFRFLSGSELIKKSSVDSVDYIIVVDSAESERTDKVLEGYGIPDLNIDHHKTNSLFAKINYIDCDAVATAEIQSI